MVIAWDKPLFVQDLTKVTYSVTVFKSGLVVFNINDVDALKCSVPSNTFSLCSIYKFSVIANSGVYQSDPNAILIEYSGGKINCRLMLS